MAYFKNKNPNLGYILEGLGRKNVSIIYGHLEYCTTIMYCLLPIGIFFDPLIYLTHFVMFYQEKSGNPASDNLTHQFSNV
jgi:hypothetical protein